MLNQTIRSIQGLMTRRTLYRSSQWRRRLVGFEPLERRELLATVTVDNDSDDVNGDTSTIAHLEASPGPDGISLREAILAANADTTDPEDTVLFHDDLNGGVIRLTMSEHLDIEDSLTIDASTLNLGLTIDANDPTPEEDNGDGKRIFDIESGSASPIRVTLKGLTLIGGDENTEGGAIRLVGEKLTIEQSIITGNHAFDGGAIYADALHNNGAELTVTDTVISNNVADNPGGGIRAFARGGQGTADFAIDIARSTITGNNAGTNGGGLYLRADKLADGDAARVDIRISESAISGNETTGFSGEGGGLYALLFGTVGGTAATLTITGSTFSDNNATENGGGAFVCVKFLAETQVRNSTFSGNFADERGGGLHLATFDQATFTTTFDATLRNVTITDNRVGNTESDRGAGLYIQLEEGPIVNTLLHNTIVSDNREESTNIASNIGGRPVSQLSSYNLVGTGGDGGLMDGNLGNKVGIEFDDPGLSGLSDFGGPTPTHAILAESPALDAGTNSAIPPGEYDQRGEPFSRIQNGVPDIGAYELQDAPRVVGVSISGTDSMHAPYDIPSGSGEQLRTVPVGRANRVEALFDQAVNVVSNDLQLLGVSTGIATPTTYTASGFDGSVPGRAAWQYTTSLGPELPADMMDMTLGAGGSVTSVVRGQQLDGEWVSPDSVFDQCDPVFDQCVPAFAEALDPPPSPLPQISAFPSGNGSAGGAFNFRFVLLPGDLNRDNEIDFADFLALRENNGMTGAGFSDGDFNGDGVVSEADYDGYVNSHSANLPVTAQKLYGYIYAVWGWRFKVSDLDLDFDVDYDDIDDFVQTLDGELDDYLASHNLPPILATLKERLVRELIADTDGEDDIDFDDIANFVKTLNNTLLTDDLDDPLS